MANTYLLISEEFSGEVNTASSLGSAPEVVGPKVGTDLKFKRLHMTGLNTISGLTVTKRRLVTNTTRYY